MFLADWSGRRVTTYVLVWLIGFPVVMTAFAIMGAMASSGSGGFTVGTASVEVVRSYLLPWLLPPALLVAAWARRSRPDRD